MKILVTGGAGFIGSHVVDLYLAHGLEVVVVDDLSTGRLANLNPAAKFYQLDVRSPQLEQVFQQERPEVVNHHAAQMDVRRSVAEPIFDADVNIGGSLNLLECSRRYGVERLIYISSGGAVYGEPEYLPCDEEHPINPICQYGASKHTVEHYLYMYREMYGLEYTVLRYPNVYGPRQDPHGEAGVVAIFAGQMLAGEGVTINGDGEQERDFVYVADCAEANLSALTRGGGIYNLGSGKGTTVREIFEALCEITDYRIEATHAPAKLGETRRIYLQAERARRDLGWTVQTRLREGLERTVRFMAEEDGVQPVRLVVPELAEVNAEGRSNGDGFTPVRVNAMQALLHAGKALDGGNGALGDLVRTAAEAVGANSGSAYLLDDEGKIDQAAVIFEGSLSEAAPAIQCLQAPRLSGLLRWVESHGQAALIQRTGADARWLKREWDSRSGEPRSAICVPLVADRTVRGAITVCQPGAASFSQGDLALLVTIAGLYSLNGEQNRDPLPFGEPALSESGVEGQVQP